MSAALPEIGISGEFAVSLPTLWVENLSRGGCMGCEVLPIVTSQEQQAEEHPNFSCQWAFEKDFTPHNTWADGQCKQLVYSCCRWKGEGVKFTVTSTTRQAAKPPDNHAAAGNQQVFPGGLQANTVEMSHQREISAFALKQGSNNQPVTFLYEKKKVIMQSIRGKIDGRQRAFMPEEFLKLFPSPKSSANAQLSEKEESPAFPSLITSWLQQWHNQRGVNRICGHILRRRTRCKEDSTELWTTPNSTLKECLQTHCYSKLGILFQRNWGNQNKKRNYVDECVLIQQCLW